VRAPGRDTATQRILHDPLTAGRRRAALAAVAAVDPSVITAPAERWQHGQDLRLPSVRRTPTTVASGVQALRHARAIDDSEVTAAGRFFADYIFGVEGVRDPAGFVLARGAVDAFGTSATLHGVQLARAAAITRHRAIANAIGPMMTVWLVDFVVLELSFVAMQKLHMPGSLNGRLDMRGRLTAILLLLSRLYAAIDGRGKRDAP
jgi:hypothetical protein